jgi:uncharacterized protein YlzI (FlbEa/FlbD family)
MKNGFIFIPLTVKDSGDTLYLNLYQVGAMFPKQDGTELIIQGERFLIKESYDEIIGAFKLCVGFGQ